ncbi:MAG: helix-turn-helix domain-containing protein [Bryobacterales bacterium]|nr:helix-turn-helix domain-containing protein [Bryobacteraceae bacterium]MDW8130445.1 helix-turn-helix domain-containing protein [Bryobacterales bacterium]
MQEQRSAPAFGPADLAALRQQRGVSLEQIAETTKISVAYLRAIEAGRFDLLPGGIYDLNYLRQYARAVGLDEEALIGYYRRATGQAAPGSAPVGQGSRARQWLRGPASLLRSLV